MRIEEIMFAAESVKTNELAESINWVADQIVNHQKVIEQMHRIGETGIAYIDAIRRLERLDVAHEVLLSEIVERSAAAVL